jgi:hypothetical protein
MAIVLFLNGCLTSQIVSLEKYAEGWIGQPINELKEVISRSGSYASRIGWQEVAYEPPNGNWVYVQPDREDCFIHWEIDCRGISGNNCWLSN